MPGLDAFAPDLVLISAGFDAHVDDPLAGLEVETADFAWLTEAFREIANTHAEGRIVSVLEGGYDLGALADAVDVVRGVTASPIFHAARGVSLRARKLEAVAALLDPAGADDAKASFLMALARKGVGELAALQNRALESVTK